MDIASTVKEIKGPFSFIYYQRSSKFLYFARDRFGRHSLLFNINENFDSLLLTSVAVKTIQNIVELPAIGVFIADLSGERIQLRCIPWYEPNERFIKNLNQFKDRFNVDVCIVASNYLPKLDELSINTIPDPEMGFLKYIESTNAYKTFDEIMESLLEQESISRIVNTLLTLLNESVRRRVQTIPHLCKNCTKLNLESDSSCQHTKVGLLFSGGLDSAILAAIVHKHVDISETIDLINVAFEKKNNSNYQVPDRITGKQTYGELLKICPERKFNFIEVRILKNIHIF